MEYEILNDKSGVKKERVLEGHRKGLLGVIRPKKVWKTDFKREGKRCEKQKSIERRKGKKWRGQ